MPLKSRAVEDMMSNAYRFEGYAIISVNGMIADASGDMPSSLKIEADHAFLQNSLRSADALVHGSRSHEGGPDATKRRRIIVTRQVAAIARDSRDETALRWNPAGAAIEDACRAHGLIEGNIAVLGGTDIFRFFLPRYNAFHLTRAYRIYLPGGRPLFPEVPERAAEELLAYHGLKPGTARALDKTEGITLVSWFRESGTNFT